MYIYTISVIYQLVERPRRELIAQNMDLAVMNLSIVVVDEPKAILRLDCLVCYVSLVQWLNWL